MKRFAIAVPIFLAAQQFHFVYAAVLDTNVQSTKCVKTGGLFSAGNCIQYWNAPQPLWISEYWLEESRKIIDTHWYANLEKIVCSPDTQFSICAFIEYLGPGDCLVPGM